MATRSLLLTALVPLALLTACGGGDDGDGRTVDQAGVPLTFEVPSSYQDRDTEDNSGQDNPALVVVGRDDINLIALRRSGTGEPSLDVVEKQLKESLAELGFASAKPKREQHSGREMIVFDVDNEVKGQKTSSKLYFFTGGGGTWEIECQSTEAKRDEVSDACTQAVDSVKFREQ